MSSLSGRAVQNSYKDLLYIDNGNNGVDGTLRFVLDGEGSSTPMKASTTSMEIGSATLVDGNRNEVLETATTASAVNHTRLVNAATGNDPVFKAVGGDSDIGLIFRPKGSGSFTLEAAVTVSGALTLQSTATLGGDVDGQNSHKLINTPDPSNDQDAATKKYVDNNATSITGVNWEVETSDNTAADQERKLLDASGGSFTQKLPASPKTGATVWVADVGETLASNNVTLDGNGNNIDGSATQTLNINGGVWEAAYDGGQWELRRYGPDAVVGGTTRTISSDLSLTVSDSYAQHVKADTSGLTVSLPDATNLVTGLQFEIYNRGQTGNTFALDDGAGNPLITGLGAQEGVLCHLHDNSKAAGVWSIPNVKDVTVVSGEAVTAKEVDTISTSNIDAAMLDVDVGIVLWVDSGAPAALARAVDFSTDPPTLLGSQLTIESVNGAQLESKHSAVRIDASNILTVYRDKTNNRARAAVLNWDGNSLTVQQGPITVGGNHEGAVAHLSGNQYIFVALDGANSTFDAFVLKASSSTLSVDIPETTISNDAADSRHIAVAAFDGTYAIAVWDNTTNSRVDASLIKVSGGSISNPDNLTGINNAGTGFAAFACNTLSNARAVAAFEDNSNDDIEVNGITFDSGNETITNQSNVEFSSLGNGALTDNELVPITSEQFYWSFQDGSATVQRWLILMNFDGSTVSELNKLIDASGDNYNSLHIANNIQSVNRLPLFFRDQRNSGNVTASRDDVSALFVEPQ